VPAGALFEGVKDRVTSGGTQHFISCVSRQNWSRRLVPSWPPAQGSVSAEKLTVYSLGITAPDTFWILELLGTSRPDGSACVCWALAGHSLGFPPSLQGHPEAICCTHQALHPRYGSMKGLTLSFVGNFLGKRAAQPFFAWIVQVNIRSSANHLTGLIQPRRTFHPAGDSSNGSSAPFSSVRC